MGIIGAFGQPRSRRRGTEAEGGDAPIEPANARPQALERTRFACMVDPRDTPTHKEEE
jgi:hypothetical protein